MRSKSPSGFFYSALSPLLFPVLIGLLVTLSGCKGENQPSPPELPAGVINISKTEALSIAPDSAASGETLYVVWQEHVGDQNMEVFLSRSGDGGATFGAPVNVSQTSVFSGNPQIAASGNFVYIVWEETVPTNVEANEFDIFYRRGEEVNGTFDWYPTLDKPPLRLSNPNHTCTDNSSGTPGDDPCPSQTPTVAAFDSNVFVVWSESTVYQFKIITTTDPPAKEFQLINSEILMVHSADGGLIFDVTPLSISGPKTASTPSPSINPTLAATAGKVYIAWEEIPQPLISKILFRRVVDPLSISFSPSLTDQATLLSGFIRGSNRPSLAAEGSRVYLAWEGFLPSNGMCPAVQDNTPISASEKSEIFFIRSEDKGEHYSNPNNCAQSNVSNTTQNSNSARITASGSFIYLTWMDSTPGLAGILFKKSEDNGNTFTAPARLISGGGSAANPSIAAVNGTLFTTWEDATLGNLEIVFTRR